MLKIKKGETIKEYVTRAKEDPELKTEIPSYSVRINTAIKYYQDQEGQVNKYTEEAQEETPKKKKKSKDKKLFDKESETIENPEED